MAKKRYLTGVVNPVLETGNHWETQEFKKGTHNGEDLINRTSSTKASPCWVIAIDCGTVTYTGYTSTRGNYVEIQHDNGKYSRYLHLKDKSIKVKKGDLVKKSTLLGYMGESGASEGIHLHLAILSKINGIEKYEDPYPYLIGEKSFNNNWDNGTYIPIKNKYVRLSAEVKTNNKIKYNSLNKVMQSICTKDKLGYAMWEKGKEIELSDFKSDTKGNLWGVRIGTSSRQPTNTYICVRDSSGNQVIKE